MKVRRLGYALGAEVVGLDLRRALDPETIDAIRAASLEHIVLCFRDADLDAKQMRAICGRFGELDENEGSLNQHRDDSYVLMLTNKPLEMNGEKVGNSSRADHWHSDFSFRERPTTYTFLGARALPHIGGDTMFANQYMAYETLSPRFQTVLEGLTAIHDIACGRVHKQSSPEQRAKLDKLNPPVLQPLVRVHPETSRKTLYVGEARIRAFQGMSEEESAPLLDYLNAHATRYEFVYRHRWAPNDLVMWDNRCALHYGVRDYDQGETRYMMRCSIVGPKTGRVAVL